MTKGKRFDYRVVPGNNGWAVDILRRITSKKTGVSKSQGGFDTEAEAHEWGQKELKLFVQNLGERNKRRSKPQK